MTDTLTRQLRIGKGHDSRNGQTTYRTEGAALDRDYGIEAASLIWIVRGRWGAVVLDWRTDWYPPSVERKHWTATSDPRRYADVTVHATMLHAATDGQIPRCDWLGGAPCYSRRLGGQAEAAIHTFHTGGEAALWDWLEAHYRRVFAHMDAEYVEGERVAAGLGGLS